MHCDPGSGQGQGHGIVGIVNLEGTCAPRSPNKQLLFGFLDLLGRPPIQSVWRPRVCGRSANPIVILSCGSAIVRALFFVRGQPRLFPNRSSLISVKKQGQSAVPTRGTCAPRSPARSCCSHDDARLHRPGARVHCLRVVEGRGHSHPWRGEFSWSWSLTVWQAAPVFIVHASPPCFRHPAPSCPGLTPPPPPRALARAAAPTHESAPPESVWHALLMPSGAFRPRTRTRPRTTTAPLQTTLSRTRRTASSRARSTSTWSRTHTMCVPACLPPPHPRCLVLCPFSLRLSTCAAAPSVAVADCDLTRAI